MMKLPRVADCMDKDLNTLSPKTNIWEAVDFLLTKQITGASVVDESGNLVGILSEKDCLTLLTKGSDDDEIDGVVGDYMTDDVSVVASNMNIYYVAGLFLSCSYRRFPVVDNSKLVGVVTRFDILRLVKNQLDQNRAA